MQRDDVATTLSPEPRAVLKAMEGHPLTEGQGQWIVPPSAKGLAIVTEAPSGIGLELTNIAAGESYDLIIAGAQNEKGII